MDHDWADADRAGQLHHVELYASDLDASVGFWGWLLGELGYERKNDWESVLPSDARQGTLDERSESNGGRSWMNGPTYVVLVEADHDEPAFDRNAAGLNHVAFHAGSREQVDRIADGVRQRSDASLLYEDQHPYAGGYYTLYCEDPEGVKWRSLRPSEEGIRSDERTGGCQLAT